MIQIVLAFYMSRNDYLVTFLQINTTLHRHSRVLIIGQVEVYVQILIDRHVVPILLVVIEIA